MYDKSRRKRNCESGTCQRRCWIHFKGGAAYGDLGEHCRMFSKVTIPPQCELGYHEHHGESETYYLLTGKGMYSDNGKEVPAEAGDVFFCDDGNGHGLKNTGEEDLTFVALILKK